MGLVFSFVTIQRVRVYRRYGATEAQGLHTPFTAKVVFCYSYSIIKFLFHNKVFIP